jgi:hypothetical protein
LSGVNVLVAVEGLTEPLPFSGDNKLSINIISRTSILKNYKLTVADVVKAFLISSRKISIITVLTKSHDFSLRRAELVHPTQKHLILSSFVVTFPKSVRHLSDVGQQ